MSGRKLKVEFVFESPEGALAVGGRLLKRSPGTQATHLI
jgi:hypothetical protein